MNEHLLAFKAAIVATVTAISTFLGWKGVLGVVWVVCMALDYLSGSFAACKAGAWSSSAARQGLWHKCGMILAVAVAAIADLILGLLCAELPMGYAWPGLVCPLVLAWYIITELGSILENAVALGAAVPAGLTKLLSASLKQIETLSDKAVTVEDGTKED